jgi:DNA-binding beta-propeller fold protein YncE
MMHRLVTAIGFVLAGAAVVVGSAAPALAQETAATPVRRTAPVEFIAEIPFAPESQNWPSGVAVDANGSLYVIASGDDAIRVFDRDGVQVATLGEIGDGPGQFRFHDADGALGDLALGPDGNLYVSDTFNYRIQVLRPDGAFLREWRVPITEEGQFIWLAGIAVDGTGHVYVADSGARRVLVFTSEGEQVAVWEPDAAAGGPFTDPADVAVDAAGVAWVSDGSGDRLFRMTAEGEVLDVIGSSGMEPGQVLAPWGLALDAAGNPYVAEYFGQRVQIFAPDGASLGTIGEVTGGDGPGQFNNPMYLTVSADGRLYVVDEGNHRIQIFRLLPPVSSSTASPAAE